jgi:predicted metalloprotease
MHKAIAVLACLATLIVAGASVPLASATTAADATASASGRVDSAARAQSGDLHAVVDATIDDIQEWWAEQLPDVYGDEFEPIPDERVFAYSEENPPPACGGRGTTPYEQVAGNAFYCSEGDFVAWDEQELFPRLERKFGGFAVALVLAHEWGHAIQARTDNMLGATVYLEMQADCFAGSWAKHVDDDDVSLPIGDTSLDIALGGFLEFRDPPGVDPSQQGAHGNAFDRVNAFQDGFDEGTDQCAGYEDEPPEVTETGFTSQEDYLNGGDLPLPDALDLIRPDLDDYWSQELDGTSPVDDLEATSDHECDGTSDGGVLVEDVTFCAADDTVRYDPTALDDVYEATGDFGAGMLVAAAWSSAAMDAQGHLITGERAHTIADCLTGSWAGDVARQERARNRDANEDGLLLSPGDLDEGIATFVSLGDGNGSAFERVAAFRKGFFDGADACLPSSSR